MKNTYLPKIIILLQFGGEILVLLYAPTTLVYTNPCDFYGVIGALKYQYLTTKNMQ